MMSGKSVKVMGMRVVLAGLALICGQALQASGQATSKLWGEHGEQWNAAGRISDFSFAGYRSGEQPIPRPSVKGNVRDFGARGDGVTDDTQSFTEAIAATNDGALLIPKGVYVLSDVIEIRKANLVLRGEGEGKTVLRFTRGLRQLHGAMAPNGKTANWSWEGGMIWVTGSNWGRKLAEVTVPAARGSTTLVVDSTQGLVPGMSVRLFMSEQDASLRTLLYGDIADPKFFTRPPRDPALVKFPARVRSIDGDQVEIDRPLRLPVELRWQPVLYSSEPKVQEVGIEHLTIELPNVQYVGHWKEIGNNAVQFDRVSNCWIQHVSIRNADNGIFLEDSNFCTVQNVTIDADPRRLRRFRTQGMTAEFAGHHGIQSRGGGDHLVTEFDFKVEMVHDLTVENTSGTVFSNGRGLNLNFDHHAESPTDNLFTNLDAGKGDRLFVSSGSIGPAAGIRATFWNIRSGTRAPIPTVGGRPWPMMNLIGVPVNPPPEVSEPSTWLEEFPPDALRPVNLHEAQLARRLSGGVR